MLELLLGRAEGSTRLVKLLVSAASSGCLLGVLLLMQLLRFVVLLWSRCFFLGWRLLPTFLRCRLSWRDLWLWRYNRIAGSKLLRGFSGKVCGFSHGWVRRRKLRTTLGVLPLLLLRYRSAIKALQSSLCKVCGRVGL